MIGSEIIITFRGNKAFLAPDKELPLNQLDLPEIVVSFKTPVSWLLKIINYNPEEKLIFAEIINYFDSELEFTDYQLNYPELFNNIEKVNFRTINTIILLRFIETEKSDIKNDHPFSNSLNDIESFNENITKSIDNKTNNNKTKDIIFTKHESFSVAIKDLKFGFGCICFSKKIKGYEDVIDFNIINYDIREEFDAIKNYFANILKTKKINVETEITFTNWKITATKAKSLEIDKINSKVIDTVKFEFVGNFLKKKKNLNIDKSLFTMDDCFAMLNNEKLNSNAFYTNDKDLLEDLLEISKTKHYKHLRFLSSKHAYRIMKLRFIIKPFSFIFLIEGDRNYHIIWETLDTEEATYIWHIEKDKEKLKLKLMKIEDIINVIRVHGKIAYINSQDDSYQRVFHDYSDFIDGFVKWKSELESLIN